MLEAAHATIVRAAASEYAGHLEKATARLPASRLAAAPFEMEIARIGVQRDGSIVYAVEGIVRLAHDPQICTAMRMGGSARRDRAGTLRKIAAWSSLVCNDNYVGDKPLAIIERGNARCWVIENQYEDGLRFVLSKPGDAADGRQGCDIK